MRHIHGFSLIEILITLTIISILAGIGLPLYSQHLVAAHRLEAKITLEKLAAALEQYYTSHNTYSGATLKKLGFSSSTAKDTYQISISTLNENSFSLAATPLSNQAQQDILCGTLTLNAIGEKHITGNGQIAECWG